MCGSVASITEDNVTVRKPSCCMTPSMVKSFLSSICVDLRFPPHRRQLRFACQTLRSQHGRRSSAGVQHLSQCAASSGNEPASPRVLEARTLLKTLGDSVEWEMRANFLNSKGGQVTFSQFAAWALQQVECHLAVADAAATPNSSSSALRQNLLHFAELMQQYESFSISQRHKLLESVQQQLIPKVNVLVGVPLPDAVQQAHASAFARHHAVAASRVVPSNSPQQQQTLQHVMMPAQQHDLLLQDQHHQHLLQSARPKLLAGPKLPIKLRGLVKPAASTQQPATESLQQQQVHAQQQAASLSSPTASSSTAEQQQDSREAKDSGQQQQHDLAASRHIDMEQQQQPPQPPPPQQQQLSKATGRRLGPPRPNRSKVLSPGSSPWPAQSSPANAGTSAQGTPPPTTPTQHHVPQQVSTVQRPSQPSGNQALHPPQQQRQQQQTTEPGLVTSQGRLQRAQTSPAGAVTLDYPVDDLQQQQLSQSSNSSSRSIRGGAVKASQPALPRAVNRPASPSGPYPPRLTFPHHHPLSAGRELQHAGAQQQQVTPAWQLYFPLPEELGGPSNNGSSPLAAEADHAMFGSEECGSVTAVGTSAAAAADLSQPDSSATSAAADAADSSHNLSRRKQVSDERWRALVECSEQYQHSLQQNQQWQQQEAAGELKQRSQSWLRLRQDRLTASALPNMLSWFDGQDREDHIRLWREKLGLQQPPPPNEKMLYGTKHEHRALHSYQRLSPHETLRGMGFALWGTDGAHDWLSASPDGLITSSGPVGQMADAAAGPGADGPEGSVQQPLPGNVAAVGDDVVAWVKEQTGSSVEGVLEIKCPFKASPHAEMPYLPKKMDPYYMPQVQLLCEVLHREWAVVYYWSETLGSHMTLVKRDREYFSLLWRAMADFWWRHLVPAKLLLEADPSAVATAEKLYKPSVHPYRAEIIRRSKAMVAAAPQRTFSLEQTMPGAVDAAAELHTAAARQESSIATETAALMHEGQVAEA